MRTATTMAGPGAKRLQAQSSRNTLLRVPGCGSALSARGRARCVGRMASKGDRAGSAVPGQVVAVALRRALWLLITHPS
jgi:hypothetical protein